jgi:hypothetical protein
LTILLMQLLLNRYVTALFFDNSFSIKTCFLTLYLHISVGSLNHICDSLIVSGSSRRSKWTTQFTRSWMHFKWLTPFSIVVFIWAVWCLLLLVVPLNVVESHSLFVGCGVILSYGGSFGAISLVMLPMLQLCYPYSTACRQCPPVHGKLCRISSVGCYSSAVMVFIVAFHLIK